MLLRPFEMNEFHYRLVALILTVLALLAGPAQADPYVTADPSSSDTAETATQTTPPSAPSAAASVDTSAAVC